MTVTNTLNISNKSRYVQCYFYVPLYCNHEYKVVVIMDISKEIEMYLIKVISYDFVIIVQCFFFNGNDCDRRF